MGTWGEMAAFSFQATKPLPGIEGGMANYQKQEHYERGSTFGHYDLPTAFPADSDYRQYHGSGLGLKLRMHPMAAALVRTQLRGLDKRNTAGAAQVRRLNDRLMQLPGLYEQTSGRTDMKRLYYAWNMLFIDEAKAGHVARRPASRPSQAEGVQAGAGRIHAPAQAARSIGSRSGGTTCPRSPSCPAPRRPTRRPSGCPTLPRTARTGRPVRQGLREGLGTPKQVDVSSVPAMVPSPACRRGETVFSREVR